jgi:uncharacterized protein involved in exopolysaccharide biosynthesis
MNAPSFDLLDIFKTIRKYRAMILVATVAAMVVGGVFYAVKKKKYKATAAFLVNNPLYGDRNTLFRNHEMRFVDYFGGDDDVDRVMALLSSDTVMQSIIRNCRFDIVYNSDINDPKGNNFLLSVLQKNMSYKRTELREIEVSYIAYDSVTAANVANMTVSLLNKILVSYYTVTKQEMIASIGHKKLGLDSAIVSLTDSLATLRDRHHIYSIISPARQVIGNGDIKGGGPGYGKAIEEIQNVASVKDQYVLDRAKYISLMNEFAASADESMDFLKLISRAHPPSGPTGPTLPIILISAAFVAFFFTTIFFLIREYYLLLRKAMHEADRTDK